MSIIPNFADLITTKTAEIKQIVQDLNLLTGLIKEKEEIIAKNEQLIINAKADIIAAQTDRTDMLYWLNQKEVKLQDLINKIDVLNSELQNFISIPSTEPIE